MLEEGKAKIEVFNGVFYNPYARLSRDIGVSFLNAASEILSRKLNICEPLSATGIRGIRYVLECDRVQKIILNDKSEVAYENILYNIKINNLTKIYEVHNKDAIILLYEHSHKGERFDLIDIDPFGSPMKFIMPAISSIVHKGFLAVTATDTAALCGVAKRAGLRKYLANLEKTEFLHEVGIRALASAIIRIAAINEIALEPIYSHSTRHYMRIYFRVYVSTSKCDSILENIGFLFYCENCLWRGYTKGIIYKDYLICPICNNKNLIIGPIWLDKIVNKEVATLMKKFSNDYSKNLIQKLFDEAEMPPFFYEMDKITSKLKISELSLNFVIEKLRNMGYVACRTHFSNKGIKTNADIITIKNILTK